MSALNLYLDLDEKKIKAAEKLKDPTIHGDFAEFVSSSSGEVYNTTLLKCTCRDFTVRGGPCKHMIRFAMLKDVPITYKKMIPTYVPTQYGEKASNPNAPAPEDKPTSAAPRNECAPEDLPTKCTIEGFLLILERHGIAVEDKRSSGGCLWIENTRQYEEFLSSVKVDGKPLSRTPSPKHFKWQYAWFIK